MKKALLCLSLAALLVCAGCGTQTGTQTDSDNTVASQQTANYSVDEWVDMLSNTLPFDDDMTLVGAEQAMGVYGITDEDGYSGNCTLLISTMATPEEVAVFTADDALSVEDLYALATSRIEKQKAAYQSYAPQEMPKLESAVVKICGDKLIVVVCADNEKAESVISANMAY